MRLAAGAATDVGLVRANNQDQMLLASPIFAVADGMGGHAAGEVASLTAVDALRDAFERAGATTDGVVAAARAANRAVWDAAQARSELHGMGTTLTAIALVPDGAGGGQQLAVVNVGDSRTYVLHDGELAQVTVDHSYVAELVAEGQIDEAEAEVHPQRHVLTRALGVSPDVDVDLLVLEPLPGDRYLLCSDGLSREVSDEQVASTLRRLADPGEAARELVTEARHNGGSDNITVVVVDILGDPPTGAAAGTGDPTAGIAADPGPGLDEPTTAVPATPGAATPGPASPGPASPGPTSPGPASPDTAPPGAATPGPGAAGPDTALPDAPTQAVATVAPPAAPGPTAAAGSAAPPGPTAAPGAPTADPGAPTASPATDGDTEAKQGRRARRRTARTAAGPRARIVTVRVVAFFVLFLAILAVAGFGTEYYARSTYYVGLRGGRVTIFQGRPGGVLWWKPTVSEVTAVGASGILAYHLPALRNGVQESSLGAARDYVTSLRTEKAETDTGSSSTGTTSTTVAP